jgi:4-hydroxybenzoate polyprenyltransferase
MNDHAELPADGTAGGAPVAPGGLVQRLGHYARLARFDRPVGTWLLLWPTLWGVWVAGAGSPAWSTVVVFTAGVVLMRAFGCVVNDLADRRIDPHVRRTAGRPLASGAVTVPEAVAVAAAFGLGALTLLWFLNPLARWLAVGAAALAVVYPFCKRFFDAPQVVLGAAFAWGIPMAFAAETGAVPRAAWLWWLVVVVWAVMYDTIYALADRDDDLKLGVRSTAVLFGAADLYMIAILQGVLLVGLVLAGQQSGLGGWYQAAVAASAVQLVMMSRRIRGRDPAECMAAFRANQWLGVTVFAGIVIDYALRAAPAP